MKKQKQLTLFGQPTPSFYGRKRFYIVHKNPKPGYESFVERYCLRNYKPGKPTSELHIEAQKKWKEYSKNAKKIQYFLELQPGEKEFVRFVYNNFISVLFCATCT